MSILSNDLIFEILSWLPATSLVKFRLVSKSWLNEITSSTFAESHLNRGSQIDNPRVFFTMLREHQLCNIECNNNAVRRRRPRPLIIEKVISPTYPWRHPPWCHVSVIGSCNGLVCLSSVRYHNDRHRLFHHLWNPSTKVFKDLPIAPINILIGYVQGFGYDRVLKDYKIVVICLHDHDENFGQLVVYTLGTNSWRTTTRHAQDRVIDKYPHYQDQVGLLVNVSLHWIYGGTYEEAYEHWRIISLDIAVENDLEVPAAPMRSGFMKLHLFRGCLCGLDYTGYTVSKKRESYNSYLGHADVWVMKEYGVKESWTKLFTISHPAEVNSYSYISNLFPCKNGSIILVCVDEKSSRNETPSWDRFLVYDPKNDNVKKLHWLSPRGYNDESTNVYFGSLVSLKSGASTNQEILRSVSPVERTRKRKRSSRDKRVRY